MKSILVLSAVFCFVSAATGQWLETTIYLPDEYGGQTRPQRLAYNPQNNTVYVGSLNGRCVIEIDGTTSQKVARIPACTDQSAFCYNPDNNMLYCANWDNHNVTVIDCATNQAITTIAADLYPLAV